MRRKEQQTKTGFSLVEIMVAMVVLAVGLLGMAAMTILVMRGNKGADQITVATSLATQKMEALKDVGFDLLGTCDNPGIDDYFSYGFHESKFTGPYGPMNSLGEITDPGPEHIYYRAFSICDSTVSFCGANAAASTCTADLCAIVASMDSQTASNTPKQLACYDDSANDDEKRIRVVTYWLDRFQKCHRVAMDTIVVDLSN